MFAYGAPLVCDSKLSATDESVASDDVNDESKQYSINCTSHSNPGFTALGSINMAIADDYTRNGCYDSAASKVLLWAVMLLANVQLFKAIAGREHWYARLNFVRAVDAIVLARHNGPLFYVLLLVS